MDCAFRLRATHHLEDDGGHESMDLSVAFVRPTYQRSGVNLQHRDPVHQHSSGKISTHYHVFGRLHLAPNLF